jgi:GNAT superfamily N-acetyltransferase
VWHGELMVTVTLLSPEDARDEALVAELVRIVNGAHAVGEAGLWIEGTTRTGPAEIAEAVRSGEILAAVADDRLVGCACVRPLDDGTADLGMISTAQDRWGGGISRRLIRSAEELMRSRGLTTMQLEVLVPKAGTHPAKERLRAWYTQLGYRVVRTAPFGHVAAHLASRLAVPCEFLIFRKPLTALSGDEFPAVGGS